MRGSTARRRHRLPQHLSVTGGGQHESEKHPQGGALAGSVCAEKAVDVAFTDLQIDGVDRSDLAVAFRQSTSSDDMPVGDGLVDHVRAMRSVAARVNTSGVTVPASRNRMPSRRYGVTSKPTGPTRDTVPTSVS